MLTSKHLFVKSKCGFSVKIELPAQLSIQPCHACCSPPPLQSPRSDDAFQCLVAEADVRIVLGVAGGAGATVVSVRQPAVGCRAVPAGTLPRVVIFGSDGRRRRLAGIHARLPAGFGCFGLQRTFSQAVVAQQTSALSNG